MADRDQTQFRFDFGGVRLELSGEREFVELMYRRVMEDVEEVRRRIKAGDEPKHAKKTVEPAPSIWVHRCSDMMRKIYMVSSIDLKNSAVGRLVDVEAIGNIYIRKEIFHDLLPRMRDGQTLWAEFTPAGRKKIEQATRPTRRALDASLLKLDRERKKGKK